MKPFNLKEALKGKPVITRDGREVTQLHLFDIPEDNYPLVGVIKTCLYMFKLNGEAPCTSYDLFMAPIKTKYYIYIYQTGGLGRITSTNMTQEEWNSLPVGACKLIKTLEFEIDEYI